MTRDSRKLALLKIAHFPTQSRRHLFSLRHAVRVVAPSLYISMQMDAVWAREVLFHLGKYRNYPDGGVATTSSTSLHKQARSSRFNDDQVNLFLGMHGMLATPVGREERAADARAC